MNTIVYPPWAESMRQIFRAETINQFIIHGNIHDVVPHKDGADISFVPLREYLSTVLFSPFEVVIHYDRGQGIVILKGAEHFFKFLRIIDKYHGTKYAADAGVTGEKETALGAPALLPRSPVTAVELIDRFINGVITIKEKQSSLGPKSVAVIIDYAHFVVPRSDVVYLSSDIGSLLIKILNWAEDPSISGANVVTCLLSENLLDLNECIAGSSYNAKITIDLPSVKELEEYAGAVLKDEPALSSLSEVDIPVLAQKLLGLNRINIKNIIFKALRNNLKMTHKYLTQLKKETIEKEAMGKLEFIESKRTLDDVAGHFEAKRWLREDAHLIKKGVVSAIPMGYLITGRIGTGKTYLVQCFAGECGIPFVEMKNFRDKWVGATEGNLEKIFSILHALGQVVVFVDEADQATGRRNSGGDDSGLSGRIYGMLAKEMANTDNRGKIIWIFATSRPDLVEVDLKRQGRLDVHIPLFPPVHEQEKKELFFSMAKKLKMDLKLEDLPTLNVKGPVGGNEFEGLLVRAIREYELQPENERKTLPEVLHKVSKEFKVSAHTTRLELMDLLAVKECTDARFLPERFAKMDGEAVERRIGELEGIA